METLKFILVGCFVVASAFADNALPVGTRDLGGKTLTIFAHPAPLRAGPVQFAVMLTDRATGEPDLKWQAKGSLQPVKGVSGKADWVPPCCRMASSTGADGSIALPFSTQASGNGLMRGANVTIAKSGPWTLNIDLQTIDGITGASFPILVGEPPAPLTRYWLWFLSLPLATLAYLGSARPHKLG